jgi:hypothetical protein
MGEDEAEEGEAGESDDPLFADGGIPELGEEIHSARRFGLGEDTGRGPSRTVSWYEIFLPIANSEEKHAFYK